MERVEVMEMPHHEEKRGEEVRTLETETKTNEETGIRPIKKTQVPVKEDELVLFRWVNTLKDSMNAPRRRRKEAKKMQVREKAIPYHTFEIPAIVETLHTSVDHGLSTQKGTELLHQHGRNELTGSSGVSYGLELLGNHHSSVSPSLLL
jgi:hypothetical protein